MKRGNKTYEYYTCNQYINHQVSQIQLTKQRLSRNFYIFLRRRLMNLIFKGMLASKNNSDKQVLEFERIIKRKEKEIKESKQKLEDIVDELLEESTERVKTVLRKRMEKLSLNVEELQAEIAKKKANIKNLESQNLNQDEIVEVFQYVGKVIKSIEDKEKQQALVRRLVAEIQVEDKHIKEVHFRFSKKFRIGGGKGNRIISK